MRVTVNRGGPGEGSPPRADGRRGRRATAVVRESHRECRATAMRARRPRSRLVPSRRSPRMPAPIRVVLAEDHARCSAPCSEPRSPPSPISRSSARRRPAARRSAWCGPSSRTCSLLDIELAGGQDGVEVTSRVTGGSCRVLAYSSYNDPVHVTHLLQAGASGYLSKGAPIHRIAEAVRAVAAGESRWFEAGLGGPPAAGRRNGRAPPPRVWRPARHARPGSGRVGRGGSGAARGSLRHARRDLVVRRGRPGVGARARRTGAPVARAERGYSVRANVPGQASAARVGSYGA